MLSAFQTFGKLGAIGKAIASAWSPLSLWPDGILSPGMWISPRTLTSQWQDYTGTTPVATPGTVADSSNPVGLAYDLRAGTPVLGPELVVNGDFSSGMAGWALAGYTTAGTPSGGSVRLSGIAPGTNFNELAYQTLTTVVGRTYKISFPCTFVAGNVDIACYASGISGGPIASLPSSGDIYIQATSTTTTLTVYAWNGASTDVPFDVTVGPATAKEVPGNHMLQSTSVDRPLLSAYDGQTLGPGDTYDATGYPVFQKYNGTNSGMATAAFATGTLIDGMDCMIAVRRDSAAATYLISDTASRGFFEWESGDTDRPDVSAGMPTYYVDGVAVTATRGALFTALTAGDWHILEARGLDLSTWTKVEVSSLVSYRLNGPRGDILLYPSTASTTDKDAARQWLADYYGVTLP